MTDAPTTASRLAQARAAHQAARLTLHRDRERLARAERTLAVLQQHFNPVDPQHQTQDTQLGATIAALRGRVATGEAALSARGADVEARTAEFAAFSDPIDAATGLDPTIPALLFPIRMETRFAPPTAGTQAQLWVRFYPDDCVVDTFEETMSETELARVREFWVAWAAAGGAVEQQRGAWRVLAGRFGSGRAGWLLDQHRPANLGELPNKDNPSDTHLVIVVNAIPADAVAIATYWTETWRAGTEPAGQAAAQARLAATTGQQRAAEAVVIYRPANLATAPAAGSAAIRTVFVALPDPQSVPTQRLAWSQPAEANVLPERLVLLGFRDGVEVLHEVGALIPQPLAVGPNPLAEPSGQIQPDGTDLALGDELRWLTDFDEAVRIGMGLHIDLNETNARAGFDELIVLGLRLSADPGEGKGMVETLLRHHQAGATGLALLPTGAATNNTESASSAYRAADDPDLTFDLGTGRLTALRRAEDPLARLDSQWLADALGLDLGTFDKTAGSRGTDQAEARAMNMALWPATWGYFLQSMLAPVLDERTIDLTRWFFTRMVTGRGLTPAIRIGKQPYGILPATALSRIRWYTADGNAGQEQRAFLAGLTDVLARLGQDWQRMSGSVAQVGRAADAHQALLDIVGLGPASVEYHRRWAESLEQVANRLNLAGVGAAGRDALAAMRYSQSGMSVLAGLGYAGTTAPEILEKFFLDRATLVTGDLIDDRPLSETEAIRAWTPTGANYLGWLADVAQTSFDTLRTESGFINDTPPRTLLYLLLRYALQQGYWDAGVRWLAEAGSLSPGQLAQARIDPSFVHVTAQPQAGPQAPPPAVRPSGIGLPTGPAVGRASVSSAGARLSAKPVHLDQPSESRYEILYRSAPGGPGTVAERISATFGATANAAVLRDQIAGLKLLQNAPTARLERALAEHIDLASYRLDGWQWGLLHEHLESLRSTPAGPRTGLYVGAYGWLENVRPKAGTGIPVPLAPDLIADFAPPGSVPILRDPGNDGYLHAPSLNHAVTAAVLRSGYLSGVDRSGAETLAVDLSSRRVRTALDILDGLRGGQSLGALLGYRFERGLHDRHEMAEVDRFIYALRLEFPLVANKFNDTSAPPGQPIQTVEARNVVDGLALTNHIRASGQTGYPFGRALPTADPAQTNAINTEVGRLLDNYDALADLATAESIHQAALGNYGRLAGGLDALAGAGGGPPEPEIVRTPRSGVGLTHRVALHLSPTPAPAAATPRAVAEPALNAWLSTVLPPPEKVTCLVDVAVLGGGVQTVGVSQRDLGLQPIDLIHLVGTNQPAASALDDRIAEAVRQRVGTRPDATIAIRYRSAAANTFSFFETTGLADSLRDLVQRSRPLTAADLGLTADASAGATTSIDPQRFRAPLAALRRLVDGAGLDDLTALAAEIAGALADPVANEAHIVAAAERWADRYVVLAGVAAHFGSPHAATGAVRAAQGDAFRSALGLLAYVVGRWRQRLADFDAMVAAAGPGPAGFDALRRAERLITTQFSTVTPATPADFAAMLVPQRNAFAATLTALATIHDSPPASTAALLGKIGALLPLTRFDRDDFPLAEVVTQLRKLAVLVADHTRMLAADVAVRVRDAQAKLLAADAAIDATDLRVAAAKALFGPEFVVIPEVVLAKRQADELANAWADRDRLLRYLAAPPPSGLGVDFPVDDWLYGMARVREKLALWERMVVTTEALGVTAPDLTPLQFPYRPGDVWLGLQFPPDYDLAGERLAYTAHFSAPVQRSGRICGLLLDEWTEVLPAADETSGIAFHYDRPESEPPQAFLLAMPPQLDAWRWADLVDAVRETFAAARSRAVEPNQIDAEPLARLLPAVVMAATVHPITIGLNLADVAAVEAVDA